MIRLKVRDQNKISLKINQPEQIRIGIKGEVIVIHDHGDIYEGEYEVSPTFEDQILPTQFKYMEDDVTVNAIEVSRTSNPSGGKTVYIGGII